ncbi:MAG: response regulator transcription factor [Polyangia bacterium]
MKVLVIEDDPAVARALLRGLGEEGHEVEHFSDGAAGLAALSRGAADVCILDLQLPVLDGLSLLRSARARGVTTPVLVVTARDAVPDRVEGLRGGADDYLTKPFAFAELVARLEVLVRRAPIAAPTRVGDLELDLVARKVTVASHEVVLSEKQFALLAFLVKHAGQVVARATVLQAVFGYDFDPGTNIVDVHILHLRKKIDTVGEPSRIASVRGVGYRLEPK